MRTKTFDRAAVFQSVRGAAAITGLSVKHIREGCRAGTIPHIKVGTDYRINLPLFLEQLTEQSVSGGAL